ncbi:MAG TPA: CocE/NonD family hydrolase [Herpetosiphonaceae bacterium]
MPILSTLINRLLRLPPAETQDLVVERDLRVPMRDGTTLLADRYAPRGAGGLPTLLVRSPYGRANFFGWIFARPFAERGFQVLIQSCRGTFGSGGEFDAFRNEERDGLDTVAWLERQPWFAGSFATLGPSYLGHVQWALAAGAGPSLKARCLHITTANMRDLVYPGESFGLDTALTWIQQVGHQEDGFWRGLLAGRRRAKELAEAAMRLPLREADLVAAGKPVSFYRDWLDHNQPGDPWWAPIDFSGAADQIEAPALLIAGWYDIFLPYQLEDYARLRQAGQQPYLTIGPWAHTSPPMIPPLIRESLAWLRAHLLGRADELRAAPVRVFVMGSKRWAEFPDWPPPGYAPQRWHLQPARGLAPAPAGAVASAPDRYRFDSAQPTPAVGGSSLSANAGPKDNRSVEARPDVLVYTSAPLERDTEVIGPVEAEIFLTSSLEHTDVFVRLCDVDPKGRSVNISDGLTRLAPGRPEIGADGIWRVRVELWATAHCFKRGHRIRVQVAGGSHPRFARNPGSGEPLASATTLLAAEHAIYHDPDHPSAIILPVKG